MKGIAKIIFILILIFGSGFSSLNGYFFFELYGNSYVDYIITSEGIIAPNNPDIPCKIIIFKVSQY